MLFPKTTFTISSIIFMIFASMFIASTTIIAKMLGSKEFGEPLNAFQISHSRFLFAFLIILTIFITRNIKFSSPNFKLHFLRSFSGWLGVSILFGASSMIPISDAIAINFTNPIFAMLLAVFILKERVGTLGWIAVLITFSGAILLIRPDFNYSSYEPMALISILGAIALGLEATLIKLLTKVENTIQILLLNNSFGLLISSIPIIYFWETPTMYQLSLCFLIGTIMICAQFCFLKAIRYSNVSFIVPFFYNTLIFVTIFDYLIFNTMPDKISAIGSFIIVFGGLVLYWKKYILIMLDKISNRK